MRRTAGPGQAGFTLIELMVVVGLIAVLAAVAVPMFMAEEREATADAEVNAMFTEMGLKEQEYKLENGVYFSTGATDAATFPATPTMKLQNLTPQPATWNTLKINPPEATAKCGYVAIAGLANAAPGAIASGQFGFTAPKQPYYYLIAHCNLDGSTAKDGYYFQSSTDSTIKKINAGY
jgi:prepilin-type N-terminal cleavage/methylation domain-containing protein